MIRDCASIEELNRIIGQGLDEQSYELALNRLFQLVAESEDNHTSNLPSTSSAEPDRSVEITNDIDALNSIIAEDNWESNISHLAFQKILQLAGVDELLQDIPESAHNQDDTEYGLHTPIHTTEYSEQNLAEGFSNSEDIFKINENNVDMIGGEDPLHLNEIVSNIKIISHLSIL